MTTFERQITSYIILLVLVSVSAFWGYRVLRGEYLLIPKARKLEAAGQSGAADQLYLQAALAGLGGMEFLTKSAETSFSSGDFETGVKILQAMLQRQKFLDSSLLRSAAGLCDKYGLTSQALDIYRRYSRSVRLDESAGLQYADLLRRLNNTSEAIGLYRKMIADNPQLLPPRLRLAETLAWSGNYPEAMQLSREILSMRPEYRPARLLLARVLSWTGDNEAAIAEYRHLLGDKP